MSEAPRRVPPLPEHRELRELALALERFGAAAEILDERFRCVFLSSETVRIAGLSDEDVDQLYGLSLIRRTLESRADVMRTTEESSLAWWRHNVPIIRHYVAPEDPDFADVFGAASDPAAQVEPAETAPRAWHDVLSFPPNLRLRGAFLGDSNQLQIRINDDGGRFLGVLYMFRGMLPDSLLARLGRGDERLFERMERVSEPSRRQAAILFADLEASGVLSRRLSSRGYFDLIRDLTDLIDSAVIARDGIVGKHAGDGGSALFVVGDFDGSESAAARAAIEAAVAIRAGAGDLGPGSVRVNVGLHWGATLMIGQVTTRGRLDVTALGDQMNEAARIEAAATGGTILASKDLVERLDANDARAAGVDPDAVAYTQLGELEGVSDKAIRDAGGIPVTAL